MNNEHLNQLLKEHYDSRRLPDSRAARILADCKIARTAYRWRIRALGALSLAASSIVALGIVLCGKRTPETLTETVIHAPANQLRQQHKLVAVMIHATNCPNSKAMEPVFAELQENFGNESVLFIKFDYSSDCARHQAELLSSNLGLGRIFEQFKKTGDIILVSSQGEVREVLDRGISITSATTTLRKNVELIR